MGFIDELKRLARPFEDEEEFDDAYEPIQRTERRDRVRETAPVFSSAESDRKRDKVVSINTTTKVQVVLAKPERFASAPEIADHLAEKRTVVLNLEQANKEESRRLIDFLSGVAYSNGGTIKKVAISTYIITPYNVDILGDLVSELENNGMYS